MTAPGFALLRSANGGGNTTITISKPLSEKLREAGLIGATFHAELTEDGILFRLIERPNADIVLPPWMENGKP